MAPGAAAGPAPAPVRRSGGRSARAGAEVRAEIAVQAPARALLVIHPPDSSLSPRMRRRRTAAFSRMGEKQRYVTGACDGERFANMYPSRSRLVLQQRPDPSE